MYTKLCQVFVLGTVCVRPLHYCRACNGGREESGVRSPTPDAAVFRVLAAPCRVGHTTLEIDDHVGDRASLTCILPFHIPCHTPFPSLRS